MLRTQHMIRVLGLLCLFAFGLSCHQIGLNTPPTPTTANPPAAWDSGPGVQSVPSTASNGEAEPKKRQTTRSSNGATDTDWLDKLCDRRHWYGDEACSLLCSEKNPDCVLGLKPEGKPTEHPIVLAHGFSGRRGFYKVAETLRRDGHTVVEAKVPPYHHQSVRAHYLARIVRKTTNLAPQDRVNIIAHSMGGLDARYLISKLPEGRHVASLTTIATPHRGTRLADVYLNYLTGDTKDRVIVTLAEKWGLTFNELAANTNMRRAMVGLSTQYMTEIFNARIKNRPGVYYQSWAGVSNLTGGVPSNLGSSCEGKARNFRGRIDELNARLYPTAPIVSGDSGELDDGRVTVESAKWGNFRGCVPADHYDLAGHIEDDGVNDSGFDHIRFYRNIAYDLAERGY